MSPRIIYRQTRKLLIVNLVTSTEETKVWKEMGKVGEYWKRKMIKT